MKAFNAIIKKADLTLEDAYLELSLFLELSNGGCVNFGGYCLHNIARENDDELGNYAGKYICKVFEIVGVRSIKDLEGRPVRAIFEGQGGTGSLCIGLQDFLNYRKYFIPDREKAASKEVESIIEP